MDYNQLKWYKKNINEITEKWNPENNMCYRDRASGVLSKYTYYVYTDEYTGTYSFQTMGRIDNANKNKRFYRSSGTTNH